MTLGEIDTINRQRRQLTDAAISHATRGEWEDAARANQELLELGPDTDAYNRLGKALAEMGRDEEALAAYRSALERDSTNRIAERNVARLEVLLASRPADAPRAASKVRVAKPEKALAAHFIEEMGKTGHARVINLASPRDLAPLSPGDAVELVVVDDEQLVVRAGEIEIGQVEPRVGARLAKLISGGNRYEAAITVLQSEDVRIIIRETFAHPSNFDKVSFPGSVAARPGDVRPYIKGTALRYDDEEESEELDEESEEVEELDTTLPEFSGEPELEEELLEES
ncbi:MAG TPA: tetratricopeptide repeat protein [Candidatus Limnocylindria bacterium]|nr:tetratricopeptide repeat protein [Candidatus Limnocylindria bacterium]